VGKIPPGLTDSCICVALQSLLPYFGLPCCVVPFLHSARCCLFKVGGCLFDKPHGTQDLHLAENSSLQLWASEFCSVFFGFENWRSPGWHRVSCTERRFWYFFGKFSGTVIIIIIISFALSCRCSLNYYCVEPLVLKWNFWRVKPGLSTCAPFPGSSGGLINKI
jgi:hypothetical protein